MRLAHLGHGALTLAVLALLGSAPGAQAPLTLGITLSGAAVTPGQTLTAGVTVSNPGGGPAADFYFAILLPDGSTVVSAGPGVGARFGRMSDLRTLVPVARNVGLGGAFQYQHEQFFTYAFTGAEPRGTYRIYFVAFRAGALGDGVIGGGELLALRTAEFVVGDGIVTVVDPSRQVTRVVPSTGGTVETTAANGVAYQLSFPEGALDASTSITVAPIVSVANLPSGLGGFALGLNAGPSGLTFTTPARLTITLPDSAPISPQGYAAFIASGQERQLDMVPVALDGRTLTIAVPHFSDVVVTNSVLGFCGGRIVSPQMADACQIVAAAFDVAGDVEEPAFKVFVRDLALTPWYNNGLRTKFGRLSRDEPAPGETLDGLLDAVNEEWLVWAGIYSITFGPIRIADVSQPLHEMIADAFASLAFGTRFAQSRANARCLADKPHVGVYVQRVQDLEFAFNSTFDEPYPFPTEYCLDLHIDGAPPPVLTPGQPVPVPVSIEGRFTDGMAVPGAKAVVSIAATDAAVTPAGGIVSLPLNQSVTLTPASNGSLIDIAASFADPALERFPTRRRRFSAGQLGDTILSTALLTEGSTGRRQHDQSAPEIDPSVQLYDAEVDSSGRERWGVMAERRVNLTGASIQLRTRTLVSLAFAGAETRTEARSKVTFRVDRPTVYQARYGYTLQFQGTGTNLGAASIWYQLRGPSGVVMTDTVLVDSCCDRQVPPQTVNVTLPPGDYVWELVSQAMRPASTSTVIRRVGADVEVTFIRQ